MITIKLEFPTDNPQKNIQISEEIKSIEEGIDKHFEIMAIEDWGASNYQFIETGVIFNNKLDAIARVSYNGRVWNLVGRNLTDFDNLTEIKKEDFKTFLEENAA